MCFESSSLLLYQEYTTNVPEQNVSRTDLHLHPSPPVSYTLLQPRRRRKRRACRANGGASSALGAARARQVSSLNPRPPCQRSGGEAAPATGEPVEARGHGEYDHRPQHSGRQQRPPPPPAAWTTRCLTQHVLIVGLYDSYFCWCIVSLHTAQDNRATGLAIRACPKEKRVERRPAGDRTKPTGWWPRLGVGRERISHTYVI